MGCCNKQRQQVSQAASKNENQKRLKSTLSGLSFSYFKFTGESELTITGTVTGKRYRFYRKGIVIPVDTRDSKQLNSETNLKLLSYN